MPLTIIGFNLVILQSTENQLSRLAVFVFGHWSADYGHTISVEIKTAPQKILPYKI
jgi:hypothetical protein